MMTIDEAKKELEKFVKLKTTMRPAFVDIILNAEPIEIRAAYEQKAYNKGYADGKAESVKHGHWIWTGSCQVCSICDEEQYGVDTGRYYCPNCGARMDAQIGEDKSHPFAESVMMGMDEVEE